MEQFKGTRGTRSLVSVAFGVLVVLLLLLLLLLLWLLALLNSLSLLIPVFLLSLQSLVFRLAFPLLLLGEPLSILPSRQFLLFPICQVIARQ